MSSARKRQTEKIKQKKKRSGTKGLVGVIWGPVQRGGRGMATEGLRAHGGIGGRGRWGYGNGILVKENAVGEERATRGKGKKVRYRNTGGDCVSISTDKLQRVGNKILRINLNRVMGGGCV